MVGILKDLEKILQNEIMIMMVFLMKKIQTMIMIMTQMKEIQTMMVMMIRISPIQMMIMMVSLMKKMLQKMNLILVYVSQ